MPILLGFSLLTGIYMKINYSLQLILWFVFMSVLYFSSLISIFITVFMFCLVISCYFSYKFWNPIADVIFMLGRLKHSFIHSFVIYLFIKLILFIVHKIQPNAINTS